MRFFQWLMIQKSRALQGVCAAFLCTLSCALLADDLPALGETSSLYLSSKKEYEIGQLIVAEIKQQEITQNDWVVAAYIQKLQNRLTQGSTQPKPEWFVLQDKNLNAFALPGGFIGIHSGLIENLSNEDELAAVLAHEWAHVTQHHLARLAEQSGLMNLRALAGALASIALATQNASAGAGALSATLGGTTQSRINFTREHEAEADRVGMQILAKAGFDPHAMPDLFLHFQREERYMGKPFSAILSTHPLSAARIADAMNRAAAYPKKARQNALDFLLIKARLNLLMQTSSQKNVALATRFVDALPEEQKSVVHVYAKAVAALLEQEPTLACTVLENHENAHVFLTLAAAECATATHQDEKAYTLLNSLLAGAPFFRPAILMKAELLLTQKNALAATTTLQRYLRHDPTDSDAYALLARTFYQQNDLARMHEAEAESRYYACDFYGALSQFEIAKKLVSANSIAKKRISAKIKATQNKINRIRKL